MMLGGGGEWGPVEGSRSEWMGTMLNLIGGNWLRKCNVVGCRGYNQKDIKLGMILSENVCLRKRMSVRLADFLFNLMYIICNKR